MICLSVRPLLLLHTLGAWFPNVMWLWLRSVFSVQSDSCDVSAPEGHGFTLGNSADSCGWFLCSRVLSQYHHLRAAFFPWCLFFFLYVFRLFPSTQLSLHVLMQHPADNRHFHQWPSMTWRESVRENIFFFIFQIPDFIHKLQTIIIKNGKKHLQKYLYKSMKDWNAAETVTDIFQLRQNHKVPCFISLAFSFTDILPLK